MNCFQITLRSGQQLQICTEGNLLKLTPEGLDAGRLEACHYFVDIDEIAAIINVGDNNICAKQYQDKQVVTP